MPMTMPEKRLVDYQPLRRIRPEQAVRFRTEVVRLRTIRKLFFRQLIDSEPANKSGTTFARLTTYGKNSHC